MTRKATLVAVVALLALGTSAALAFSAGPGATGDAAMAQNTTTAEETTAMDQETTMAETATVTFEDQTSNGSAVVVDEVTVPEGGFVVIHAAEEATDEMGTETGMETEMDTETEMVTETEMDTAMETESETQYTAGEVLGNSTYLEPGTHENVTVTLDAPLEEDQVLIAMPHLDTNDNQLYEFPEADDPYTDDAGAVVAPAEVTVEEDMAETTMADDGDEEDDGTTTE